MKQCKKNLSKLKALCNELTDRDAQLKINAKTLWIIVDEVNSAKELLNNGTDISLVISKLENVSIILQDNKCKKVGKHEG